MTDEVYHSGGWTDKVITTSKIGESVQITLTKSSKGVKGSYHWEISIHAATVADAERQIAEADDYMRQKYGSESVKE